MIVKKKIWKQLISVIMVCTLITGTADIHTALAGGVLVAAQNDGSDLGTKSISGEVPVLDDHVYSIASANELVWVADKVASGNNFNGYTVKLVSDIDMTDVAWGGIGYNLNNYFSGIFDGCNHTIRNLAASGKVDSFTIINSPRHTIGLFGVCIGAEIKNLVIENTKFNLSNESGYQNAYSSIDGTNIYCGVVVGYAKKCKFQNLTVENSSVVVFTGVEAGNAYAGGIAGYAEQSDFVNCCNKSDKPDKPGEVQGKSESMSNDAHAGGIAGELDNEGVVRQCYNTAKISGEASIAGIYVGGIIGKTFNNGSTLSTIRDCYNKGEISYKGSYLETSYLGGIIGYSSSTVNRCYDSGDIHAYTNVDTAQLGGIAGSGIKSSLVSNCAVMASTITGGTSQFIISGTGTKENNIAYNGLSVKNDATERYAINDFHGNGLYKSKLQWDFSSIWKSVADDFPVLQPINQETDNNAQIVDQAAEQMKIKFAKGDSYDRVTQNVTLEGASNGASVTWSSNREEIVSSMTGVVHRRSDDCQIRVTATISSGNYSVEKRFILNVIGTENSEAVVAEEWAMNLDDARQFVSLMNKCKFKDVDVNDPDVLVLTGNNVNDDAIAETMAKVMTFWEVPEENAYLKPKMGKVLEMIKNGQDKVLKELVSDLGDGWVDCSTGSAQLNKKNVSKNILKIPCKLFNIQQDFVQGYEIMKQSSDFKLSGSPYDDGWNIIKKVGKVIDYIVKTVKGIESSPIISGSISGTIGTLEKIHECIKLYGAYKDAEKNAVKAYLHTYMNIRDGYDSPDDPVFQTLMASHIATSIKIKDENISEMAEQIYRINKKFSSGLSDQYKITIKCPVDIAVYDNSGKIVGRVINNEIDNTIPNSILITLGGKNNDEKTLHFQDEENYNILLTGNDTGSMDIDVESQSSDNVTVYTYNDIELNKGKEMTLDVSYGNYSEDMKEFPVISMLDENGAETKTVKALDSVKKEYRLSVYSCIEEADGKITLTNDGGYCISNYTSTGVEIKSLIHVNKGYKLEGLYLDDQCQKQFSESVMTDKALILYAKFIKTGATTAGDDETDAEHFYEDYSNTIKATNATIQVYANGGKVHIAGSTKKKDSRKCTVYTDILASYKNTLNNKGIVKPAVGKVVVGITKFNVKPEVNSKNKITDASASSIAKAKIKNGQITVTAVGKEGGLVYLWVIDTGNKGVSASCPINVKLAPNKLEVQDTAGSKLTNTKLANGNTLEVCVAGLVGLTKTDDCTYTATVDSKYKSYITVTPVDGSTNKFTIKAIGFKNDKDTKAVVIFKCDQNGKKTNFSLTVTN